jgi:uncharacterized repeat protein (TIGR01451 family)
MEEKGMPDLIGQTIEQYQIVAKLSQERWGELYKAYDAKFDRTVSFHALDELWASQDGQGDYVLQTTRAALRFRHPGIARVYDSGSTESQIYIVTEFIPGSNLAQILEKMRESGHWISLGETVQLSIEIAQALDYIHLRGLVHGDLHPGRVSLRAESGASLPYQPVLIQLGFIHPEHPIPATSSTTLAPEITTHKRIEPRADIYALGLILFELVTGSAPTTFPPTTPRNLRADLPADLEKIITTCLETNPSRRFPNAGVLAKALLAALPTAIAIGSSPVGLKQISSPLPFLQESLSEPGQAPLQAPEPPGTEESPQQTQEFNADLLHILEPGKEPRSIELHEDVMTIGRGADNHIVIDQPGISRHHAQLSFDGSNYTITDLHSTNGTFRDDQRLAPGQGMVWAPGENIRIGEVWLRLERSGQMQTTRAFIADATRPAKHLPETMAVFMAADGRSIEADQVSQSSRGWVGATVDPLNLAAMPGGSVSLTAQLFNRGPQSDTFHLALQGVPPEWITTPLRSVSIPSGGDRSITLTIRAPRDSTGRAGRHQILLRVESQSAPNETVELRVLLTVAAFSEFSSELQPIRLRSGQVGQVLIENRGNLPETYKILWEDRFHNLVFEPPQMRVTIPPGKSAAVEYRPAVIQPRWFGSESTHPYKAHITAQTGQLQTHSGEYVSRALIPPWAPIGLVTLCLVLACFVLFLVNSVTAPGRASRRTADAMEATIVQSTLQAAEAGTQTAIALSQANQATLQAATATALWANDDDDQDGLSNSLEILAGTSLNDPDTDRDGLDDGPEVNTWKTNPLNPDTDGDTLTDGVEVQRGLNPLKRDTDGDGLDDAIDPDPLNPPTRTPIVILTFTPKPPTLTPTQQIQYVDLNVSISNGRPASVPGTTTSYSIVVINRGPMTANNVQVTSVLPPTLTNGTWTCAASVNSRCQTPNGIGNVNARLDLPVGGQSNITINAQIPASANGQIALTALATQAPGVIESNPVDNQATDIDNLTPRVSLTLSKSDGRTTVLPGQPVVYTIEVRNSGPSLANGISLTDNLPAELTAISWACNTSPGGNCSVTGTQTGNVNTLVSLPPGGIATVVVNTTVRPAAQGTLSNTASITSPIDPGENNKSATDTTSILPLADLNLEVSAPPTVTVSSPMTYTLNITNTGPAQANELTLEFTKLPDVTFITYTVTTLSVTVVCNPALGEVICTMGNLPAGNSLQMQIGVLSIPVAGDQLSVFDIHANENDPNIVNNTVEVTTIVN